MKKSKKEEGYVLVTALVLLSILTIVGVASSYKTIVEIKVSKLSADSSKAAQAAEAGLNQTHWDWFAGNGGNEVNAMASYMMDGLSYNAANNNNITVAMMPMNVGLNGNTVASLEGLAGGNLDAYIQAGNGIRVYQYQQTGGIVTGLAAVANGGWADPTVTVPQVAIWTVPYQLSTTIGAFPYLTAIDPAPAAPAVSPCQGQTCGLAVYALGRSAESRRLVREILGVVSNAAPTLTGVSALTNAPPYGSASEACNPVVPKSNMGGGAVNTPWPSPGTDPTKNNTVIDATQAPYVRNVTSIYSNPSGTAIKSNTVLGQGGKGFRNGLGSTTGAAFAFVPHIAYSGHGPNAVDNTVEAGLADGLVDITDPYSNLPGGGEFPHNLIKDSLLGTSKEVDYFANANSQLFNLDAYRWGAEQFTCQDLAKADGVAGNGRYCSRAEALRSEVSKMWSTMTANPAPALAPVSGRLTIAEFEYNSNYGIPMFGVVRVMMPTTPMGGSTTCVIDGVSQSVTLYQISGAVATMTTNGTSGSGAWDGDPTINKVDSDGQMDGTARVLVYGSLLFDYFTDTNNNNVFDPASGERLLNPIEAVDSYMKIEYPILINPSMPRGTLSAFPTVAVELNPVVGGLNLNAPLNPVVDPTLVNVDTLGANRALMSPYDGYFPSSEGLLQQTDSANYTDGLAGTMRLMGNGIAGTPAGLSSYTNSIAGTPHVMPAAANAAFANHKTELNYYYDLMVAQASPKNDIFAYPIAPFPADLSGSFYIGVEDKNAGYNQGDAFHLLFPSAYMHGWKVALSALDLNADQWNSLLTGLDTGGANSMAMQHLVPLNFNDANMPKGSPFNSGVDVPATCGPDGIQQCTWAEWMKNLEGNQTAYFEVKKDGVTGYGLIDSTWADIPAEMYVGGLLDMHAHANITGVVYTPGPLEWEPGNSGYAGDSNHFAYINGAIITGFGAYVKNKVANGRYVLSYDIGAVDNATVLTPGTGGQATERRFAWQSLN